LSDADFVKFLEDLNKEPEKLQSAEHQLDKAPEPKSEGR
jgi:hypothetical protein